MNKFLAVAAGLFAMAFPSGWAQTTCHGTTISGTVRDSTLALVPGAALTLDGGRQQASRPDGTFQFPCVRKGAHVLSASAPGFARRDLSLTTPHDAPVTLMLRPEVVNTQVTVSGGSGEGPANDAASAGPTEVLSGKDLQALAGDPDDLLRELQQLAAAGGGNPTNTIISVDGFQGPSKLPPKASIAYIKVNPDVFSAEYREPPFEGGRVEVYTKPGQTAFHGALFAVNGSPFENARDPFSTSKGAIGKQRYGFELTGPVRKVGSDFALTLEHRSIDDGAVVNAVTLDSAGNTMNTIQTVNTPQSLWLGTARLDWQLGARNTFIATYSANVNSLQNLGVGGTALAETGYNSEQYEHMFRLSDVTVASVHLMHEARLSLRWDGEDDTPVSTAPQVQVAGAFTGGGATLGAQQLHEFNVEYDDDVILTPKNHTLKIGMQFMLYDEHQQLTTNFNGSYIFGGGTAPVLDANNNPIPGETETITGVQQYQRGLLGLAGGAATAFTNVAGTPIVDFAQVEDAFYVQDDWNVGHGVHIASGLRYFFQTDPTTLSSITPRAGILWSPSKKNTWTLHAHAGLFGSVYRESDAAEVLREDGTARVTSTIYNPVYGNPFAGATPIYSLRQYSPHITTTSFSIENFGGTRAFPHGWNFTGDYEFARIWNEARTVNINSPLNGVPTGPRVGPPDLNVLQLQNSGQGRADVTIVGVQQRGLKRAQFFFGGVRVDLVDDTDDNYFATPQSEFTNAGEFAFRSNQPVWIVYGVGTFKLPQKVQLSTDFNASGDAHYNITTGYDNNGDGDFNDRPEYAAPGTPGAVATPYGLLVDSGGIGVFPRNKGVLPWTIHLDANVERAFTLTRNAKAEHQQVLTVNVRSSNVLNHLNVTQVGGVLGSPLFSVPYAADNGRRIEAGLRYSF